MASHIREKGKEEKSSFARKKHIFKDISVGNDIFFFLSFRIKTNAISPPLTNGGGRYQSRFPSVFPLGRFRHHPWGGGKEETTDSYSFPFSFFLRKRNHIAYVGNAK